MEFEDAAKRLARDQSKLKKRDNRIVSQKAKREADYRRKQQERLRLERERKQQQKEYMQTYLTSCDRALGVKSLATNGSSSLELLPTSIHGDGEKIALPPSVLQYLTEQSQHDSTSASSPWTFRIGILRKDYMFPSSPLLQTMQPPTDDDDDDAMMDDDSDDEESDDNKAAYIDELSHKYLSYTYATVVEFTQEEGHVGLPRSIAARLLIDGVAATKTVDPAGSGDNDNVVMEQDEEKTPGHLAYRAFDVPAVPVEVTLVKLPKGRRCTVIPTMEAIHNGFFKLKDVKLVLEQSLIRTRATLSQNDTVHTWHRGIRYDLQVASVVPSDYQAVSIINTDLEVDIGANEEFEQEQKEADTLKATTNTEQKETSVFASGKGHVLSEPSSTATETTNASPLPPSPAVELLAEPPVNQTEGVCTVQIRGDGANGRRRFDVNVASLQDLFAFAASLKTSAGDASSFRLVTRFPRRVFTLEVASSVKSLADCGIGEGQELFMLEQI